MSESELHAILNEIKNKGQVPDGDDLYDNKKDYAKIIENFNSVTKEDALEAFSTKREEKKPEEKHKKSIFAKVKKIFKK